MKLIFELNLDNDSFAGAEYVEDIGNCLAQMIQKLRAEEYCGKMRDINGNTVGRFEIITEEETQ